MTDWAQSVAKIGFRISFVFALLLLAFEILKPAFPFTFQGPFQRSAETAQIEVFLGSIPALRCCVAARDPSGTGRIIISIADANRADVTDVAAVLDTRKITFDVPAKWADTAAARVYVSLPIAPKPSWISTSALLTFLFLAVRMYRRIALPKAWEFALQAPSNGVVVLLALGWLILVVFLGCAAVATAMGVVMPPAAAPNWIPAIRFLAQHEHQLGNALLFVAVLGWIASLHIQRISQFDAGLAKQLSGPESRAAKHAARFGLPLMMFALLFSASGQWAGLERPGDISGFSLGGLVPFSDAGGYYSDSIDQMRSGFWSYFSARRPMAAAFRSGLFLLSGQSAQILLVLQPILLGIALAFATTAVFRFFGLWSAVAYFAIGHITSRGFGTTFLTEPLGLMLAYAAIPYFLRAQQARSLGCALAAFAFICMALFVRMGAMFLLPAFAIWIVWMFCEGLRTRLVTAAICGLILLTPVVLSKQLARLYSPDPEGIGGNFSYTLCGLSVGSTWSTCGELYKAEIAALPQSEAAHTGFMYKRAFENILARPTVFLGRTLSGAWQTLRYIPTVLARGYQQPDPWSLLACVMAFGLALRWSRQGSRMEQSSAVLVIGSIVSSGALIFFDDGTRTLSTVTPLVAALAVMALAVSPPETRSVAAIARPMSEVRYAGLGLGGAGLLCLFLLLAPGLSHRIAKEQAMAAGNAAKDEHSQIVASDGRMLGWLVVDDAEPLDPRFPTMHISDFKRLVAHAGLEDYQGLLRPNMPSIPFGFVAMSRLEPDVGSHQRYIVPARMIKDRQIRYWHVRTSDWQKRDGRFWYLVTRAEPWSPR